MSKQSNLTVKGQVTIPKDVRDALGLKAGQPVEFIWDGGDEAVIRRPKVDDQEYQRRYEAALANIDRVREKYAHFRTGRDTDEIMRELRGDEPLP